MDETIENRLLQSLTNVIAGIQKNFNQIGSLTAEIIDFVIFEKSPAKKCVFGLIYNRVP